MINGKFLVTLNKNSIQIRAASDTKALLQRFCEKKKEGKRR